MQVPDSQESLAVRNLSILYLKSFYSKANRKLEMCLSNIEKHLIPIADITFDTYSIDAYNKFVKK